jgi:hypothetical protein
MVNKEICLIKLLVDGLFKTKVCDLFLY